MAAPSSVAFPSARSSLDISSLSLSHHQTATEICELFYGESPPAWQTVDRFYDPNATYENPFVTATSKGTIGDVHALSRYLSSLDVPKPGAILCTLFRLSSDHRWRDAWFRGVRMWNEVNDISECESFDGHKRTMVEHTIHILILPGLHPYTQPSPTAGHGAYASPDSAMSLSLADISSHARRHYQMSSFYPPSPLHLKLPIITRLSFNDAGKIIHHRDFWDVKDLLGLVPGMTLAQWISGRLAAQSISVVVRAGRALFGSSSVQDEETGPLLESPLSPQKLSRHSSRAGFTTTPH